MLTDPTAELQAAIMALLLADDNVTSLVADRVFDKIPNVPVFPYIKYGETQIIPELGENTDAAQAFVTIHAFDRFKSSNAVRGVGKYIVAALHDQEVTMSGGAVLSILLESSRTIPDPDGLTNHLIATFEILTDANAI